ncbi:hypothetical protein H0H92_001405 [Tricholoma furcatifolium]|nr:hypothetical protein H0H92_001405 [Tricholoma furcatifolium]
MTMESTTQAGCFGSLNLRNLLARASRRRRDHHDTEVQTPKLEAKDEWSSEGKYDYHYACSGADWVPVPGRPPSYSAPPEYAVNDSKNPALDLEVVKTIEAKLDELDPHLRDLSLKIHSNPELAFQEKWHNSSLEDISYAHDILTKFMEKHGFTVTRHYAGLKTAWRAEYTVGNAGRILGVNSEMDALPGIGHACGHNLIAISGLGIAIAVKAALVAHEIPGKVIILGTPAEEDGGGKIVLLERGAYQEMDVCLM